MRPQRKLRRTAPRLGPVRAAATGLLLLLSAGAWAEQQPVVRNGFRLDPASVPLEEILPGGPPRDGIPALDEPAHVAASEAFWPDDAMVLGFAHGGKARAYPIAILDWHELVNDEVGGREILVSWCPLCGTGMVFDRRVDGRLRRFGVSGLLYRSDVLMYDRETQSLWSQIASEALTGPSRGQRLRLLPSRLERWGAWRRQHPGGRILSRATGHGRAYDVSPYAGYARSDELAFPAPRDDRYHPKTPTVGLRVPSGAARAYPADELRRVGGAVEERFAGRRVRVAWDEAAGVFRVTVPDGIEVVEGYWFAWAAFHPETSVYVAPREPGEPSPRPGRASSR